MSLPFVIRPLRADEHLPVPTHRLVPDAALRVAASADEAGDHEKPHRSRKEAGHKKRDKDAKGKRVRSSSLKML